MPTNTAAAEVFWPVFIFFLLIPGLKKEEEEEDRYTTPELKIL